MMRKRDAATIIYCRIAKKHPNMDAYEFRQLVMKTMSDEMHLTSDYTRKLYYAHARHVANDIPTDKYDNSVRLAIAQKRKDIKRKFKIDTAVAAYKKELINGGKAKSDVVQSTPVQEEGSMTWDALQELLKQRNGDK